MPARRSGIIALALAGITAFAACETPPPSGPASGLEPSTPRLIIDGEPDNDAHPYVGFLLIFADIRLGNGATVASRPVWRCSGTQLTPTVFLTAGHCVYPDRFDIDGDGTLDLVTPVLGRVYFNANIARPLLAQPYDGEGSVVPHPRYANFAGFPNTRDLGVVLLSQPVSLPRYGQLAPVGTLDSWSTSSRAAQFLVAVGYGLQLSRPNAVIAEFTRMQATEQFATLASALTDGYNVQTIDTPRKIPSGLLHDPDGVVPKAGGTCFGDSGGPQLLPGTDQVVAVTSFGLNGNCAGTGFHYRTDIQEARAWLDTFLQ